MNFIKSFFQQTGMHIINGNEYHELNLLAEGGYGYVWRAIAAKTKKLCIIKKIIC